MKVLLARVRKGEVVTAGKVISSIGKGLCLFVGLEKNDSDSVLVAMAEKVINMRIFENEEGKLHYSLREKNYSLLCISNFTLCAHTDKGRRPSFEGSMPKEKAERVFEDFVLLLKARSIDVKRGSFGEHMDIRLDLDGPVNIMLDSDAP